MAKKLTKLQALEKAERGLDKKLDKLNDFLEKLGDVFAEVDIAFLRLSEEVTALRGPSDK